MWFFLPPPDVGEAACSTARKHESQAPSCDKAGDARNVRGTLDVVMAPIWIEAKPWTSGHNCL